MNSPWDCDGATRRRSSQRHLLIVSLTYPEHSRESSAVECSKRNQFERRKLWKVINKYIFYQFSILLWMYKGIKSFFHAVFILFSLLTFNCNWVNFPSAGLIKYSYSYFYTSFEMSLILFGFTHQTECFSEVIFLPFIKARTTVLTTQGNDSALNFFLFMWSVHFRWWTKIKKTSSAFFHLGGLTTHSTVCIR